MLPAFHSTTTRRRCPAGRRAPPASGPGACADSASAAQSYSHAHHRRSTSSACSLPVIRHGASAIPAGRSEMPTAGGSLAHAYSVCCSVWVALHAGRRGLRVWGMARASRPFLISSSCYDISFLTRKGCDEHLLQYFHSRHSCIIPDFLTDDEPVAEFRSHQLPGAGGEMGTDGKGVVTS